MEALIGSVWRSPAGAPGNGNEKRQLQGLGDELDAFSEEELRRRPEVRIINKYALVMAYIQMGKKGVGALALLWATVVLLGGFVSDLRKIDFWFLTIIAFVQAAGLSDATGDARLVFFRDWVLSVIRNITTWAGKHHGEHTQLPMGQWTRRQTYILGSKILDITLALIFVPVVYFAFYGPILCITLSALRVGKQDYGIMDGDASKANLKPALTLFYYVSLAQSAVCLLCMLEGIAEEGIVDALSQQYGFSSEVLGAYILKTKQMCVNNPASTMSWNLITYGAELLDSQLPEDYMSGGRALTMLIDQDTPLPITWLLIRSPRQRIQKLIGTLVWRSPAEHEMRWLAARIVEHLAGHLNLAHFPGALECISSLFDTSCHTNADQEALDLIFAIDRSKQRKSTGFINKKIADNLLEDIGHLKVRVTLMTAIYKFCLQKILEKYGAPENGGALELDSKQRENSEGTDEDLVLPGLRILEKLTRNRHNCTLIYNTKDLLSKIVAPVISNKLVEDIKSNSAWTKIVDGSLKVVSRLMDSSGSNGKEMCSLIAEDSDAVKNLEAVLDMDTERNSRVIELQMRVIEVLTKLALHHQASTSATRSREKLIERMLYIFVTTDWVEDYLKDEKRKIDKLTTSQQKTLSRPPMGTCMNNLVNKVSGARAEAKMYKRATEEHVVKRMKEAKEIASRLREKAGEALAMLSGDSEAIKSFIGCKDAHVHSLTEFLDSNKKIIECQTVQIEINISCRISAAVILKHLSNYIKEPALQLLKVLAELFPLQAKASSTPRSWEHLLPICCRNDIENPMDGRKNKLSDSQSHLIQQCGERRLQAELLSLVAAIRASNNLNFASVLLQVQPVAQFGEFVVRLKKMVEDNMYATPACLAIHKLSCEMVIEFIQDDQNVEVIDRLNIVGTLMEASETMAGLESHMLFAGVDRDCHGVPLKPLSSVLAKKAEDLLTRRKGELDIAPTAHAP